jgi:hypothetical protein
MFPNPITLTNHTATPTRCFVGSWAASPCLLTIPQLLTICLGHQAAGVSRLSWSAYLASAVLWFWFGIQKHDKNIYLPSVGWMALDSAVIIGVVIYG